MPSNPGDVLFCQGFVVITRGNLDRAEADFNHIEAADDMDAEEAASNFGAKFLKAP